MKETPMIVRAAIPIAIAAVFAVNAAAAGPVFRGDVCSLLGAKQATGIRGVASTCTNAKPAAGPGSKIYIANWAGKAARSPQLQVTVSLYTDSGMLALATRNLKQGLPGAPKKIAGIGSAAYEANGSLATGIHFADRAYIVAVTVTGKRTWTDTSVGAVAKAVAAKLS